jgi:hypothetical protein
MKNLIKRLVFFSVFLFPSLLIADQTYQTLPYAIEHSTFNNVYSARTKTQKVEFSDGTSMTTAPSGGDNLGNHIATTTLNMTGNSETNVNVISGRDTAVVGSSLTIRGGNSTTNTSGVIGGNLNLNGGTPQGGASAGTGGNVNITAGNGANSSSTGGSINVTAGIGSTGNGGGGTGGNITINTANKIVNGGTVGNITIKAGNGRGTPPIPAPQVETGNTSGGSILLKAGWSAPGQPSAFVSLFTSDTERMNVSDTKIDLFNDLYSAYNVYFTTGNIYAKTIIFYDGSSLTTVPTSYNIYAPTSTIWFGSGNYQLAGGATGASFIRGGNLGFRMYDPPFDTGVLGDTDVQIDGSSVCFRGSVKIAKDCNVFGGFYPKPVASLPTSGYTEGAVIYNTTTKKIYHSTETVSGVWSWVNP